MAATSDVIWIEHVIILVVISGAITAIPLILFSAGAKRIPLSLIGFIK